MINNQKILTKQQYLDINKNSFVNLTKKQKDNKYQLYRQKYLRKDQADLSAMQSNNNKQLVVYNSKNKSKAKTLAIKKNNGAIRSDLSLKLSKCLLSFARASIDPFDNITEMPCIPDVITAPAFRFRTYLEADVVVGTEGVGFAVMQPWNMLIDNNGIFSGAYSDFPVITTTSTYASNNYGWVIGDFASGFIDGWNPQSQLSNLDIQTDGVSYRLVAAGMELDYTGVLLDQSGMVSVLQWDGLNTIPNPITIPVIRQHPRSQTCATSREARCYIRYEPTDCTNFTYINFNRYYSSPRFYAPPGYYPLGIFISGATPGITFRVRAVAFFEVQSLNLPATPSEADPVGFPAFQAARSAHLPTPDPKSDLTTILKTTAQNLMTTVSGFAPAVGTAIGGLYGQPALGATLGGLSKDLIQSVFSG